MPHRLAPALAALALALIVAGTALGAAAVRVPTKVVRGNPADKLLRFPMEPPHYDYATHCTGHVSKGVRRLVAWLERTRKRGEDWGAYRCEKWGPHSASLHAEGRAEDWHLSVHNSGDRAEATRLIQLLLAPDRRGRPQALARRMGVEELIWDCRYWSAGSTAFRRYSVCFDSRGHPRKHVDDTTAHRNHIHIGLTRTGAAAKTSFWRHEPR